MPQFVSSSQLALRIGVPEYVIRRAVEQKVIVVPMVGRTRVFDANELDRYRRAMVAAGLIDDGAIQAVPAVNLTT